MEDISNYNMTGSLVCEIRVKGTLNPTWQEWFDPLVITVAIEEDQPILILTGCLPDQAALQGMLQKLYALNLPLISVRIGQ